MLSTVAIIRSSLPGKTGQKNVNCSLGLSLKKGHDGLYVVTNLMEGGPAHKSGSIGVGDVLKQVLLESIPSFLWPKNWQRC